MANQIEYIKDSDLLFQGTKKINEFAIDPANRAENNSENALVTSEIAKTEAETAKNNSINTQQQLNNIVIEGDSSVEAAQARVPETGDAFPVLVDRLNANDRVVKGTKEQLNETLNRLLVQFGRLDFPTPFSNKAFDINKINKREYSHNANPNSVYDWSNAIEVFISDRNTSTGLGTFQREPIGFARFVVNVNSGLYTKNDFILTVDTDIYDTYNNLALTGLSCNLYIRSGGFSGRTWLGSFSHRNTPTTTISAWVKTNNSYKTTLATTSVIVDVINANELDANQIPRVYNKVTTLAICDEIEGTFFQTGNDVYVHPFVNHKINECMLQNKVNSPAINTTGWNGSVLCIENMSFPTGTTIFNFNNFQDVFIFNCYFYRGEQDAFAISGKYKLYIFDSIGAFSSKDAFNYHASSPDSLAVEVNCIGYGAGQHKLTTANSNTEKTSNNGSTAHDSMNILRVGGKYYNCEGPVVADVNGCLSISLGCEVGEVLTTTDGLKAAFHMNNTLATVNKKQYVLECFGNGENVTWGIHGTDYTYFSDMEGNLTTFGAITEINPREVLPL